MSEHKYTNALSKETSPYLLQHAHNPVDWRPWCPEALRQAKEEDKPILLSIGYSACHWCHVMERESFENEQIADLMNRLFVSIKVDREERPDLDSIYMNAVQWMTGSGGWPLTVFLTPDQIPFYGGTYFPPHDRPGMPGFPRVLESVARAYRENNEAIQKNASAIIGELEKISRIHEAHEDLSASILEKAAASLGIRYDRENGGFGSAPKFPPSMALTFLLRRFLSTRQEPLLEMAEKALRKMAHGGIYDQLGGGFHRYSVDAYWLVPHFEKMLYDNALLSRVYLDAYLLTRNETYRRIACGTLDYVMREMTSPDGGFYSSQDADSEGREGKFYVWTRDEVKAVLGEKDADVFCRYYSITPEGNFEGKNILHVSRDAGEIAQLCAIPNERCREIIGRANKLLFEIREGRTKPFRDEKILTAWNGLMLRSFAEAANGFDREDYRLASIRNAEFIFANLQCNGRLLRSYKDGEARFNGYLEDYAFVAEGLLSLYEATFDMRWMQEAERLAQIMVREFWDSGGNGFYYTSADHEPLIQRPKDFYDNAIPSGNSAAVNALLRLWKFTGETKWAEYAESILKGMAFTMERQPSAFGHLLCALDFYLSNSKEIAIVGDPREKATLELLKEVFRRYLPNKVLACGKGDDGLQLLKGRLQKRGRPTAYVCENYACKAPVTSPGDLALQLDSRQDPPT